MDSSYLDLVGPNYDLLNEGEKNVREINPDVISEKEKKTRM